MDRLSEEALTTLLNTGVLRLRGRDFGSGATQCFEPLVAFVVEDPLFALAGYRLDAVTIRFGVSLQYRGMPEKYVLFLDPLTDWNVQRSDIEVSSFGTICREHGLVPGRVWGRIQMALWQVLRPATP